MRWLEQQMADAQAECDRVRPTIAVGSKWRSVDFDTDVEVTAIDEHHATILTRFGYRRIPLWHWERWHEPVVEDNRPWLTRAWDWLVMSTSKL